MGSGITDEKLNEFADALGVDPKLSTLGIKLGFRKNKVDMYIGTNRRNESSEGTSAMLFDWKRKTPRSKQIPDLVKALNDSNLVELAEEFFPEGGESSVQGKKETAPTSGSSASNMSKVDSRSSASVDFDDFEDIMTRIAKELYKKTDIDKLGKALGFGPADIGRCNDENEKQGVNYMGTLDMLRSWRQGQTARTERTALESALLKAGFIKLADDLLGTPEPGQNQVAAAPTSPPNTPAATSNSGREPTDEEITELSRILSHTKFSIFCGALGFKFTYHQAILAQKQNNYQAAYEVLLQEWNDKGKTIQQLDAALEKAELGGLIYQYKKK